MHSNPLLVALRIGRALDAIGVPYLLAGSVATSIYGELRTTQDIDFAARIAEEQVDAIVDALRGEFYIDGGMIRSALRHGSSFNLIHLESMDKVDVFVPGDVERLREEWKRRRTIQVDASDPTSTVSIGSPEDVLLHKLEWYRQGAEISDRQWRDILGVLKVQRGAIDVAYMRRWAERLNIRDLLDRAASQAGIENS